MIRFLVGHLARPGSDTTVWICFGLAVHDMSSKRRFGTPPAASILVVPPHIDPATLVTGNHVVGLLAAEKLQNGGAAEAAAEKHNAHESQNAAGPAGSGAAKTEMFAMCPRRRHTPRTDKPLF